MLSVPSFLLRKLYVRGTLENTGRGMEFRLRNDLGSGYAEEMLPVTLDGRELPLDWCFFSGDGTPQCFDRVSKDEPFYLVLHRETLITVENVSLTDEPHTIGLGFRVPGLGILRFDFVDLPAPRGRPTGAG